MLFRPLASALLTITLVALSADPSLAAKRRKRAVRPAKPMPTARPMALPFIHDDYAKAVAEARARKVPLFVESWAPW
jgi:hypothetical protein